MRNYRKIKVDKILIEIDLFGLLSTIIIFLSIVYLLFICIIKKLDVNDFHLIISVSLLAAGVAGKIFIIKRNKNYYEISKKKYEKLSIVQIIHRTFALSSYYSSLVLMFTLSLYWLFSDALNLKDDIVVYLVVFLIIAISIYQLNLSFRINKGFYGSSEVEAREIVKFIIDNNNDIDFTDSGKLKLITEKEVQDIINHYYCPSSSYSHQS